MGAAATVSDKNSSDQYSSNRSMICKNCSTSINVLTRQKCGECGNHFCSKCLEANTARLKNCPKLCRKCYQLLTGKFVRDDLLAYSVKELRMFLSRRDVDTRNCFDKEDLVALVLQTGAPVSSQHDHTLHIQRLRENVQHEPQGVDSPSHSPQSLPQASTSQSTRPTQPLSQSATRPTQPLSQSTTRPTQPLAERPSYPPPSYEEVINRSPVNVTPDTEQTPSHTAPQQSMGSPCHTAPHEREEQEPNVQNSERVSNNASEVERTETRDEELVTRENSEVTEERGAENVIEGEEGRRDEGVRGVEGGTSTDQSPTTEDGGNKASGESGVRVGEGGGRVELLSIRCVEDIESLSVKQLKDLLANHFVDYKGCCEKAELVVRVIRLWKDHNSNAKVLDKSDGAIEDDVCRICMDAVIDCILLECGHMVTCTACGKRMAECPICRVYVSRVVHVFRA